MKIFISWSGHRSKEAAEFLRSWISQVIQIAEPWVSSDMEKGKRWNPEVSNKLQESKFGIICLTPENINSNWILFESGALSSALDSAVTCILIDVNPSELTYPLAQFQHTSCTKEDIFKLLLSINKQLAALNEKNLSENILRDVFEVFYPNLDKKLQEIIKSPIQENIIIAKRSERDILEEILETVRGVKENNSTDFHSFFKYIDWTKCLSHIKDIDENYNLGIITAEEMAWQVYDVLIRSRIKELR